MKIVVVGGGLGGLLMAMLLGRRGRAVTVLERDEGPPSAGPEVVFEYWARRGVPQARQPHLFLGRAVRVLRDEAPVVLDELVIAGALRLPVDLGDGPGDAVVCSRRLTYEAIVRRAVEREPAVNVRVGAGVDDLVFDGADTTRVRGVHLEECDVMTADLVVRCQRQAVSDSKNFRPPRHPCAARAGPGLRLPLREPAAVGSAGGPDRGGRG